MKLVFTPDWFTGFDVAIETFSFIILSMFFYFSIKTYKATKNKKSLYLGIGFFLIALAELATILTKLVLFYDTTFTQEIGQMVVTYHVVKSVDVLYQTGFFFHKLFTLLGLYVIYRFPLKKLAKTDFILTGFFIIISAFLGLFFYFVFHIIVILLLILIVANFNEIYKKNKNPNTKILLIAFVLLLIAHLLFSLSLMKLCYVIAQVLQLASYVIMVILILKISKKENGKTRKRQ